MRLNKKCIYILSDFIMSENLEQCVFIKFCHWNLPNVQLYPNVSIDIKKFSSDLAHPSKSVAICFRFSIWYTIRSKNSFGIHLTAILLMSKSVVKIIWTNPNEIYNFLLSFLLSNTDNLGCMCRFFWVISSLQLVEGSLSRLLLLTMFYPL